MFLRHGYQSPEILDREILVRGTVSFDQNSAVWPGRVGGTPPDRVGSVQQAVSNLFSVPLEKPTCVKTMVEPKLAEARLKLFASACLTSVPSAYPRKMMFSGPKKHR